LFALSACGLTAFGQGGNNPPERTWVWDDGMPKFTWVRNVADADIRGPEVYKLEASGQYRIVGKELTVKEGQFQVQKLIKNGNNWETFGEAFKLDADVKPAAQVGGTVNTWAYPLVLKDADDNKLEVRRGVRYRVRARVKLLLNGTAWPGDQWIGVEPTGDAGTPDPPPPVFPPGDPNDP
jgi:hypothetical protein